MLVDVDKIKGKTRERRMTDEQVALALDMHPSTYYRKLNSEGGETFTVRNIFQLISVLGFTNEEAALVFKFF